MPFFVEDPRHWEECAADARRIAETLTDAEARRAMLEIAAPYLRMAERSRQREQSDEAPASAEVAAAAVALTPLRFSRRENAWDFVTATVNFWGRAGDKAVLCRIELKALRDHFDLEEEGSAHAQEAFAAGRERIQALAQMKWAAGAVEPDGSIMLRSQDF